ncbi:hypothetical protein ABZ318_32355 [Streptomyces sp. NPDC006197]
MYYGGDLVQVGLAVALVAQRYTASGRTHRRSARRPTAVGAT